VAGAGFKTFGVGDVLTASDVNTYLMQQSVMSFADSGARGSAIGTASEGMLSYLADTNTLEVYDGSAWTGVTKVKKVEAFTSSGTWTVPAGVEYAVAHIRAGGGGGGSTSGAGTNGGNSSVAFASGTVTATGGDAGSTAPSGNPPTTEAANSGKGQNAYNQQQGRDGAEVVHGAAVTPAASITVTVGAGGAAGSGGSGSGGSGFVWIEYYE